MVDRLLSRRGLLVALFILSAAYLAMRTLVYRDAILMSDEYYYQKTCQLWFADQQDVRQITGMPQRGEPGFPNSLFFWIYQAAFLFGARFYVAAKVMNVVFAILMALAVRSVARVFLTEGAAWLVAALALGLPATSYFAYFMPEPLYECCVWWGLAAFLALLRRDLRWASAALGACLGAAQMAKPNAVGLVAAANLVIALVGWRCSPGPGRARRIALALLAVNAAFVGVAYLLNVITTGHLAWDPVGKFYRTGLSKIGEVQTGGAFATVFAKYLFAYVMVIFSFFGPAVIALAAGHGLRERDARRTALVAFTVIGVSVLLLVSVKAAVNWERLYANHVGVYSTRYISVLFPLVVIAFFDALPRALESRRTRMLVGAALAVASLLLAAAYREIQNPLQMRELYWPRAFAYRGFLALVAGLVATTLYYAFARRPRARLYGLVLAGCVAASTLALVRADGKEMALGARAAAATAGEVEALVRPASYDNGFVVADTTRVGARFMFRFPGIIPIKLVSPGAGVTAAELAPRPEWVVLLGDLRADVGGDCRTVAAGTFCALSPGALADGGDGGSRAPR